MGIHWSVTGRYNLNCRHCYIDAPDHRYSDMAAGEIERIIEQFEAANVPQVSITGGEPFVHEDLFDIVRLLIRSKIQVSQIFTNGTLITSEVLDEIKGLGLSPLFYMSFDGCGVHDRMRGTSSTESRVVDSMRKIREAGLQIVVATSIDSCSVASLVKTYRLMKELRVQSWIASPPIEIGRWKNATTALSLEEELKPYQDVLR